VNARSVVVRPQPRAPIRGTIGRPAFGIPVGSFYQPFLWTAPVYPNVPVYPAAPYASAEYPPSEPSQVDELSYQVERLTQEVQRLRQEQELQYTQPPGPRDSPVASERPAPPTILVFRDGLQTETLGYAIVGETLWILTAQSSTKIPLSDLDLEATQKRNTERGIRFLLPRK